MMRRQTLELAVGLFVAAGVFALVMLAFKVGNLTGVDVTKGYTLKARFDNIGQLKVKAPITVGGVRIGRVASIHMDENFYAIATLNISKQYSGLPKDTGASILTAGLLGEQYVALEPGGDEDSLKQGSKIKLTQSSMVLEKLIGQFVSKFLSESDSDKDQ